VGDLHPPPGLRFGLVASRFNPDLTRPLVRAAVDGLLRHGVAPDHVEVVWTPGAFEIPVLLKRWAASRRFQALIGLGAVLQGATVHAQSISAQVSRAMTDVALEFHLPVIDAVVVAATPELAAERCRTGEASRGWYAALAALEMATLLQRLRGTDAT
jgi:6,7-dimethyl-8-ribityllumazine synthase